ncbi:MAG: MarR family winged helix-turn-helix transcriptional regulator [Bradyrhizobium sp.]
MDFRPTSAGYMTNLAARLFAREVHRQVRELGVSAGYLPVFFALAAGKALTQTALANVAAIEQPTMAATLTRMERDGLVQRRPDPNDGRSSLISLTPAAQKKIRAVEVAVSGVNDRALSGLTEKERAAFMTALDAIIRSLQTDDG